MRLFMNRVRALTQSRPACGPGCGLGPYMAKKQLMGLSRNLSTSEPKKIQLMGLMRIERMTFR